MSCRLVLLCLFVGIVLSGGSALGDEPSRIVRWSGDEPIEGKMVEVDEQGISIRVGEQILPTIIPWFDVRDVQQPTIATGAFASIAEDAWRAHTRLMRGDVVGAQRVYATLGAQYLWKSGRQSGDVSMGLMICSLEQHQWAQAVAPAMSWLGASSAYAGESVDGEKDGEESLAGVWGVGFDEQYQVLTGLPPVFRAGSGNLGMEQLPESDRITDRQRALFGYYRLALDQQSHRTEQAKARINQLGDLTRGRENRDPGIKLFEEMLVAQAHPDAQQRLIARGQLDRRVRSGSGTWIELWARLALGVSLIHEPDTASNELGVIELIHIVVRLEHIDKRLAVLASQIADEYLTRTNRGAWGDQLLHDARNASANTGLQAIRKGQAAHE